MSPTLKLNPPFRADQIGSFLRPAELLAKRQEYEEGKCSLAELKAVEDATIRRIVEIQREVGIKTITDGEFGREVFCDGVFNNLGGIRRIPKPAPIELFMTYSPDVFAFKQADVYLCESKIQRTNPFVVPQFEALKALTSPEEHKYIKMTLAAPEWYHHRHGPHAYPKDVYKNDDEYFDDIAAAYRAEIADLYARGCRNIQFDDPVLTYFCIESSLKAMEAAGVDHAALLASYIRAYNKIVAGQPADLTLGLHLCRGNFKGQWFGAGGYDLVAIKLFQEINVDCYYLEYDNERSGSFEPLKHLPPNKVVVLGVITTKYPELENVDDLVKRVHEAASIIASGEPKRTFEQALNQICISPQCGFASHNTGNKIDEKAQRAKLELVVRTAQKIWSDA